MTQVVIAALYVEFELLTDAVDELVRVHAALTHRHGERFRALERRIEALGSEGADPIVPLEALGDGHFIAMPPRVVLQILGEARELGV